MEIACELWESIPYGYLFLWKINVANLMFEVLIDSYNYF